MSSCVKCGADLPEGNEKFCPNCGAVIGADVAAAEVAAAAPEVAAPAPEAGAAPAPVGAAVPAPPAAVAPRAATVPTADLSGFRFQGRRKGWLALWLILGLIVLAAIGTGVYYLVRGDGSGGAEQTTTTAEAAGLFPMYEEGKYAYIDKSGTVAIEPQFDEAGDFHDGLAPVYLNGEPGFIDKTGAVVVQLPADADLWPDYDFFSEGLAALRSAAGDKYGYIDKSGAWVAEPQFDEAGPCSEGRACVAVGGKYGYIDTTGALVIEPQFDEAGTFSYGRALVAVGGKYGFIDASGALVIEPKFEFAMAFSEGLAAVGQLNSDGTYVQGYIDANGDWVIEFPAVKISDTGVPNADVPLLNEDSLFSEGLAIAQRFDEVFDGFVNGFIDKQGKWAIEPQSFIEWAYPFTEGRARVAVENEEFGKPLYGYIDTTGKLVIEARYDTAGAFSGGLANVSWYSRDRDAVPPGSLVYHSAYLDPTGKVVWESE